MIYYSSYDTTLGSKFLTKELEAEIRKVIVTSNNFTKVNDNNNTILFYPNRLVRKFDHTLIIETGNRHRYSVADLSSFITMRDETEMSVTNKPMYTLQVTRNALSGLLANSGTRVIKSLSSNLIKCYSDLITTSIATALSLTPEDILNVRALSAWFYVSLLTEEEYFSEMEYQVQIAKLSREIGIPAVYLQRVLDNQVIQSVPAFVEKVKSISSNPVMNNLSDALLYTVVAKNLANVSWTGIEKEQTIAIGLEHLPTFVAIVLICLTEPVFKKSGLTRICLRHFKDKTQFINAVVQATNGY